MLGIGKNMGIALVSITVIFAGLSFTIAQNVEESSVIDSGLVTGLMTLKVIDGNGYVTTYIQSDNQIVETGLNVLVRETFAVTAGDVPASDGPITHMDIGDNDTPAVALASDNVGLGSPIAGGCVRSGFDSVTSNTAASTANVASIDVTVVATFLGPECANADPIIEAGVFNDVSAGQMFARNTFTGVPELGDDDSLVIDWKFTFTGN